MNFWQDVLDKCVTFIENTPRVGLSPSGKAPGFDLGIRWFESSQPSQLILPQKKLTEHNISSLR